MAPFPKSEVEGSQCILNLGSTDNVSIPVCAPCGECNQHQKGLHCYNNSNVGWICRIFRSNLHGILLLQQNYVTFDDLTRIIQVVNVTETLLASDFTCQELSRSYSNAGLLGWQAYFGTYFVCDFTLAKSTSKAPPTMGVGDSLNVLTMS